MTELPGRSLTTVHERIWPASLSCLLLAASYSAGLEWVFGAWWVYLVFQLLVRRRATLGLVLFIALTLYATTAWAVQQTNRRTLRPVAVAQTGQVGHPGGLAGHHPRPHRCRGPCRSPEHRRRSPRSVRTTACFARRLQRQRGRSSPLCDPDHDRGGGRAQARAVRPGRRPGGAAQDIRPRAPPRRQPQCAARRHCGDRGPGEPRRARPPAGLPDHGDRRLLAALLNRGKPEGTAHARRHRGSGGGAGGVPRVQADRDRGRRIRSAAAAAQDRRWISPPTN